MCYRPSCREAFGIYPTVELVDRMAIYYCHRTIEPADRVVRRMLDAA